MSNLFNRVTVYGQPNCSWCNKAKSQLDAAGIEYAYVDITKDEAAKDYVVGTIGARQVPVIVDDIHEPIIGTASLDNLISYHTSSETGL